MKVANIIGSLLNMKVAPGNSSIFVGNKEFEIMKKPGRGTNGHIAIGCNNVDRAIYQMCIRDRTDGPTWDCAAVSLRAIDQNGNLLPYCGEAVQLRVDGPLKIIGPSVVPLRGGMAGTYLATTGEAGRAVLHCRMEGALDTDAVLTIRSRENG